VVKSEEKNPGTQKEFSEKKKLPGSSLDTHKGNVLDKMDHCHQLNRNYDY
jgi:hypothetical protein